MYREKELFATKAEAQKAAERSAQAENVKQEKSREALNRNLGLYKHNLDNASLQEARNTAAQAKVSAEELFNKLWACDDMHQVEEILNKGFQI